MKAQEQYSAQQWAEIIYGWAEKGETFSLTVKITDNTAKIMHITPKDDPKVCSERMNGKEYVSFGALFKDEMGNAEANIWYLLPENILGIGEYRGKREEQTPSTTL